MADDSGGIFEPPVSEPAAKDANFLELRGSRSASAITRSSTAST